MSTPVVIGGETIQPLPMSEIYRRLVDHVNGEGPHHWYQEAWRVQRRPSQFVLDRGMAAVSSLNVCGTSHCIAGEVVAMHDATHLIYKSPGLGWPAVATSLGVDPDMPDGRSLFGGSITLEEALPELERRLAKAIATESGGSSVCGGCGLGIDPAAGHDTAAGRVCGVCCDECPSDAAELTARIVDTAPDAVPSAEGWRLLYYQERYRPGFTYAGGGVWEDTVNSVEVAHKGHGRWTVTVDGDTCSGLSQTAAWRTVNERAALLLEGASNR